MSRLTEAAKQRLPAEYIDIYERVWDESDYVIPPSENNAFFVMTNVVLTPNQTRTTCPEDPGELPDVICGYKNNATGEVNITQGVCVKGHVGNLVKSHGEATGNCILSDRVPNTFVCEISSWCPVEIDRLPLDREDGPLIPGAESYTVFIKNSISFTRFGEDYHRNNMPRGICIYEHDDEDKRQCPIFRLGDIVRLAQGNFTKLSIKGGVIGVYITWNCDLDWSFDDYCLPTYSFRILDTFGWNFRHAHYHEENRRTLVKAYGLKFLVVVDGRASKFDLKNTVIVLVTGLGLLGLSTMFCDFILLNYSTDRRRVKEKKYETVGTTSQMLAASLRIMGASHVNMQPFKNPIRSTSIMSSMARKNSTDNSQQQHQNPENPEQNTTTSSSNPKSGFNNGNPVNPVELQQDPNTATNSMSPTISTSPPLLPHGPDSLNSKIGLPHGPDSLNSRTGLLPTTITTTSNGGQKIAMIDQVESNCSFTDHNNGTSRLNSNMPPVLPAADAIISEDLETSKVTTVLLQPENCCRVRTANHVTYSIDTKPKHTVRGSPL